MKSNKRDLVEIFGYAPSDSTKDVRLLWNLGACPFLNRGCTKHNHDQTITYGTCSVTASGDNVIICPNRLYANNYEVLRKISHDIYGDNVKFIMYNEFIQQRGSLQDCVIALGMNSGKEVKIARSLSMDWVLARITNSELVDYLGVEVQSIDITGNYRDAWHAYKNIESNTGPIPSSEHGLNWANVHKRLIPQIIRKGLVYSRSKLVSKGLFFIVPEAVYQRFEDIIGDIPLINKPSRETLTVHTYELGEAVPYGQQRELKLSREICFLLEDFATRFVTGPNLPSGEELDNAVRGVLGISKGIC